MVHLNHVEVGFASRVAVAQLIIRPRVELGGEARLNLLVRHAVKHPCTPMIIVTNARIEIVVEYQSCMFD